MLHHIFAVTGVMAGIVFPTTAGMLAFNVIQVEAGSAVYDVYNIYPSKLTAILYAAGMSISNYMVNSGA